MGSQQAAEVSLASVVAVRKERCIGGFASIDMGDARR